MARRRFFVDSVAAGAAELRGDDARHLTRVLRVEPGQRYEISDNHAAYLAEIEEARGERVRFRILEPLPAPPPIVHITLCAALVKFDRFEWIIEKATELGVANIIPVDGARTDPGLAEASRKRTERWIRIARESSQQSRRITCPEILPTLRFDRALAIEADYRYFLEENIAPPIRTVLPAATRPTTDRVAILVGPEGGWTDAERASATAPWQPVSLGPQILRSETAVTAALAIIISHWDAVAIK